MENEDCSFVSERARSAFASMVSTIHIEEEKKIYANLIE